MARERHRLKHLCLSLVAGLAILAIVAGPAQAEAQWRIAGKSFPELGITEASVLASASESLVFTIPWYATEISCKGFAIESGKLLAGGGSSGTLTFSSCSIKGPPFVAETCKLIEPVELKIKDTLIRHGEQAYDLVEAAEAGKALGTIQFKEGTECPLPLKNELKGTFVGETESGPRVKQPLTFSSALEKLFASDKLTFGTHSAELKGKATLDLGSPYEGKEWSAEAPPPTGEFTVEGSTFTKKLIISESVEGTVNTGELLVPGLKIPLALKCTGAVFAGTILLGGVGHVSLLFSGCEAGSLNKLCKIYETKAKMETETEADRGFILASGLGELILMGGKHYFLASSGASQFAHLYLTPSTKGCTLSLEPTISGSVVFALPEALTPLINQPFTTIPQAELESLWAIDTLKYDGSQAAWLDKGNSSLKLVGVNLGRQWGAE